MGERKNRKEECLQYTSNRARKGGRERIDGMKSRERIKERGRGRGGGCVSKLEEEGEALCFYVWIHEQLSSNPPLK